jgi:tetratricopeptide (TPR) repeat protein
MFSPWYGDALRDILKLEDPEAARLERKLASNPDDFSARLKLMAYEARADRATHPEERAKRFHHALWLIEHHPESELLHSYVSLFSRGELAAADFQRAVALWEAAAKAWPREAAVQWNAASFFQGLDAEFHLRYLEATAAADPNHPFAIRPLAEIYALSILNGGPRGLRAQAALAASHNLWVISNAAYMLQSQYNLTVQRGVPDQRVAELAERYFLRAKAIDPKLDRQKILPSLDPQVSARARQVERQAQQDWEAHAKEAVGKIRRLPVEAFPELPATVAGVLRARHCRVPQPSPGNPPRNVIRGEFFAKGVSGWAVLCSVNNRTTLLAFRNEHDTNPDSVATGEDQTYVQDLGGGQIGYLHEITAVGRDFIMGHFRAYGGPEPPAIDHLGIDDSFHEKASVTWYQHNGKWLKLTGAD